MYSKMNPILEGLHSRVNEAKDVNGVPVNQVRDMAKKMQLMSQVAMNDVIISFNDGKGDYDKTLTALRTVYSYAGDLISKLEQAKKLHEGEERENTEKEESVEEKHSIGGESGKWAQMEIDTGHYCGNGGRSWVSKDSKNIDTWDTEEEAKADGLKNYKKTFKFGRDWKVVQL